MIRVCECDEWQVALLGLICFCCPGMYNSIISLAGGIDTRVRSIYNRISKNFDIVCQHGPWDGHVEEFILVKECSLASDKHSHNNRCSSFLYAHHWILNCDNLIWIVNQCSNLQAVQASPSFLLSSIIVGSSNSKVLWIVALSTFTSSMVPPYTTMALLRR